jgi:phage protein D
MNETASVASGIASPAIKLNGAPMDGALEANLVRVVVDHDVRLPAMFALTFRDPHESGGQRILAQLGVELGDEATISLAQSAATTQLVKGEVTSLEVEIEATGSYVVVRGYDKAHRLHRGRTARSWTQQKDSEIATEIAEEAGLTANVEDSGSPHDYMVQPGISNWDFLVARATEIGYDLRAADGELHFKKPEKAASGPSAGSLEQMPTKGQIVYGENLVSLRSRVSAVDQVSSVEVRGWDPKTKKAIVSTANGGTTSASVGLDPASSGEGAFVRADRHFAAADSAQTAATALAQRIGSTAAEAEGTIDGDPALKAGDAVNVSGLGSPFDGKYVLASTRHVLDSYGYRTHFVVSGSQNRSLIGLVSGGTPAGTGVGPAFPGAVPALVTNIKGDPDALGRVKVKFPWLSDSLESDWARIVYPGAGTERGLMFTPEVDDEVLVCFEQGDFRRPYVLGGLFNGVDKPKDVSDIVDETSGKVGVRAFTTPAGHRLKFTDSDNNKGIKLETGGSQQESIELDAAGHKITINSSGDVTIETKGTGKVTITAAADMKLEAKTSLELKAPTVKVNGDGKVEVKSTGVLALEGATLSAKGTGTAQIDGGAALTIQGALVKIN